MTLRIRRNRPENAPGANHLRGGKGQYSTRTKVGNWVEDETESPYAPGFSSEAMMSTTRLQQLEGKGEPVRVFGGGLPAEVKSSNQTSNPIVLCATATSDQWMSTTHLLHSAPDAVPNPTTQPASPSHAVQDYRKQWTCDNAVARDLRFQTVSMSAANQGVPEKFRVRPLRTLPGTPLAVERLRERVVHAHGNLGLVSLHNVLVKMDTSGDGVLDRAELQQGLASDFGISLSKVDAQQIFGFFDRNGDGVIDISEFIHGLQGELPQARASTIHDIYCSKLATGPDEQISPATLQAQCNPAALTHPEILNSFQNELAALERHSSIGLREFEALHQSLNALCPLSAAGDNSFRSIVAHLWGSHRK